MAQEHLRDQLNYPFAAFVGNDLARKALKVAASSADIHSVLICGPKGTGKSVLARSMEDIAEGRKVVNLPLNSSEDQIFGGMSVEETLRKGRRVLSNNVLLRADGNILFVDDVNLLPDYVLNQVLNAAENGFHVVEREGISETYDCRFLFVATMDPEEGGISDHLLDRFDICVFLSTLEDEELRMTLCERCLSFQKDPEGFILSFAEETGRMRDEVTEARARARFTRVPEGYCAAISEVCNQLNVAGHRGDISVMNAACTLAALDGKDLANLDHLKDAAAMCLEHRRNNPPEQQQQPDQQPSEDPPDDREDEEPEEQQNDQQQDDQDRPPEEPDDQQEQRPPEEGDAEVPPPVDPDGMQEQVFDIGDVYKVVDYMPKENATLNQGVSGRRSGANIRDSAGKVIGYRIPKGKVSDIALCASIRASAPSQIYRDHSELAIVLKREDLREKVREKRQGNSILFLVDGSGSIGAQKRMVAVKGAILSMLKDAYQKRDRIGMAVFRMNTAEEVLPLTKSILKAYNVLQDIPTGGRTPLIHGLLKGYDILKGVDGKDSRPVMVILSDGRCNVAYTSGQKPVDEMLSTARSLSKTGIRFIVIDTEAGRMQFGLALELCRALDGTYLRLENLNAEYIECSVKYAIEG